MKPSPKAVLAIAAISTTNAATATGQIDTLGYDHASIDVVIPTADTTTNGVSVLKISEADDSSAATNFTDVTALIGGTQVATNVGYVLPAGKTAAQTLVKFNLDLKKRKRWLKLSVSPRTTQILLAIANLQIAEQEPTQAADAGVDTLVNA